MSGPVRAREFSIAATQAGRRVEVRHRVAADDGHRGDEDGEAGAQRHVPDLPGRRAGRAAAGGGPPADTGRAAATRGRGSGARVDGAGGGSAPLRGQRGGRRRESRRLPSPSDQVVDPLPVLLGRDLAPRVALVQDRPRPFESELRRVRRLHALAVRAVGRATPRMAGSTGTPGPAWTARPPGSAPHPAAAAGATEEQEDDGPDREEPEQEPDRAGQAQGPGPPPGPYGPI